VQMVQWVLAGQPGHTVTCRMGEYVQRHVERERSGAFAAMGWDVNRAVLERTGPGIWTNSVVDYMDKHGTLLEQVGEGGLA
jgi:hypothetical protein